MLRLLIDENFNGDIVRGLSLLRSDVDLVRVQDTELVGVDDSTLLAWAADNNRILLTHDRATLPDFAYNRISDGLPMAGAFIFRADCSVGRAIRELQLISECTEQTEWRGKVVYLPL